MEKNEYRLRLRRALGNSSAELCDEVMHAFEEYYAEELGSGKHPQDILDSFGSPEDLAKELVRKRRQTSADSFNAVWTQKQNDLNRTYTYNRSTIAVCVLLVLFCVVFWILFLSGNMFGSN